VFFAAAPGVVAGVVPFVLTRWRAGDSPLTVRVAGAALIAASLPLLVSSFARFVRDGRGTPAPIAPTEHLVVTGAYRHVRNPMYVAVAGAIVGQGLLLGRPLVLVYGGLALATMAAFVRLYEEPTLSARYGAEYDAYRAAVPAWWPRRTPYGG
jgi:protein-S-isoprenylcysteine O-methyltransferase Ste14